MSPRRSETLAILFLVAASGCATVFLVVYALTLSHETQWLGLALGGSLLCVAGALLASAHGLVPSEEREEEYPPLEQPGEQEQVAEIVAEAGARVTRRRLLTLAALGAGGALGTALVAPALSLGRFLNDDPYLLTPWRRGRRLVDENGRPILAADIERDDFYTAFPEGADREQIASPLVLVRLPKHELRLPEHLAGYDADGIVAYSKVCTHAGCAVAMYRAPLFRPAEPRPALVCPCHYSTFDPATGGTVLFGPAGRPLPMLPLEIDGHGHLRAKGNFDGPVGPSWWGVRIWKAKS